MLSAQQALAKATSVTAWTIGMCDNFVANMYGYGSSGYVDAITHWNSIPSNLQHPGDQNAPAGALMFWGGGRGHVAISDGAGGIYSTDQPSPGRVSHVPASYITNGWGKPYLGWTPPVFQGQTGQVGAAGTAVNSVTQVGMTSPSSPTGGLPLWLLGANGTTTSWSDLFERVGLILLGTVLLAVGIWKFSGTGDSISSVLKSTGKAKKNAGETVSDEVGEEE
jgi:hypothetical protein